MTTNRYKIGSDREGWQEPTKDLIAEEVQLFLYVNETLEQCFECSPVDMEELAVGYLYVNGLIDRPEQIVESTGIQDHLQGALCAGQVNVRQYELRMSVKRNTESRILRPMGYPIEVKPDRIMQCEAALLEASEAFRETGCIHAAGLFELNCRSVESEAGTVTDEQQLKPMRYVGEDISRYYAMYKVVGKAFTDGVKLSTLCLCTTGRLPVGYMERVIRAGIPCVVSRSAPTDAALLLAEKYEVLTFGFANEKRVNLYPTLTGCAILAGGRATRMKGIDKSKLLVNGQTMLKHIVEQFTEETLLYLSYNRAEEELAEIERPYKLLRDQVEGIGPLGGIYTVLQEAGKDGCVRLLIVACDLPWYNKLITDVLLQEADERVEAEVDGKAEVDAVVIRTGDGRVHPLCGIYRISCLPVIEQMIKEKNYKLQILLDRVRTKYLSAEQFGLDERWFTNVNTEEDYDQSIDAIGRG